MSETIIIEKEIHELTDITINGVHMSVWVKHDGKVELFIHDKEKKICEISIVGECNDMKMKKTSKHYASFTHLKMERV
tara:strand:+ start:3496 stop:3729 length:234 start_codon:yes stop_codon:yes gene_type:complete